MATDLGGLSILVTRAVHQADTLCALIEEQSGDAVRFPVTVIESPVDQKVLERAVATVELADIVIFVSPNAVAFGLQALGRYKINIPPTAEVLAVGPGTANRLAARGQHVSGVPEHAFNSEGLLQLPQLQSVRGHRVVIFRGQGGRQVLHDRLVIAGAAVDHVECYRRTQPARFDSKVLDRWCKGYLDIVILTSITAFENLLELLGEEHDLLLEGATIATVSQRIEQHCRDRGCRGAILVSDKASDESLVKVMMRWDRRTPRQSSISGDRKTLSQSAGGGQ